MQVEGAARIENGGAQAGFTLIELLVVLAIFGLIAATLSGILLTYVRSLERTRSAAGYWSNLYGKQHVLRDIIERIQPFDEKGVRTMFEGGRDHSAFLSQPGMAQLSGAPMQIELMIDQSQKRRDFIVKWGGGHSAGTDTVNGMPSSVLVKDIDQVGFRYFGVFETGQLPSWHDSWNVKDRFPQLVEISVTFNPGDRRSWPVLVAAPQINGKAACLFDLVGQECRN
jgi:general secretion pathway protein J